jgi:hypothetical protein
MNFTDGPWEWVFYPFTSFFENTMGVGGLFYVFIILVLMVGVYMLSRNVTFASMFLIVSSGLVGVGGFLGGAPELGMIMTVLAGIGIASLVITILLQVKR